MCQYRYRDSNWRCGIERLALQSRSWLCRWDPAITPTQLRAAEDRGTTCGSVPRRSHQHDESHPVGGDEKHAEIALSLVADLERDAERADTRGAAVLDALTVLSEEQQGDGADQMLARLRDAVSGALTDAADDAARLNMTPREWLDAVVLHADGREVICEPHLNGEAAMRIVNSVGGERVTAAINGEPIELHAVAGGLNLGDKAAGSFACTREQMEALQAGAQIEVVVTAPALKSAPGSGSFAARGVALPPFSSRKRAPLAAALNEEDA